MRRDLHTTLLVWHRGTQELERAPAPQLEAVGRPDSVSGLKRLCRRSRRWDNAMEIQVDIVVVEENAVAPEQKNEMLHLQILTMRWAAYLAPH